MQILTVETTAIFYPGARITIPLGPWPWYIRLLAFLLRIELGRREKTYYVVGIADDHTLTVEDFL